MTSMSIAEKYLNKENKRFITVDSGRAIQYYNSGIEKSKKGDYKSAEKDFSKSLKLNPANLDAYHCRGYARNEIRDYRGALEDINKILKINPNYKHGAYNRDLMETRLLDLKNCSIAVLDIETTGLNANDKIIDIGIVVYSKGKMIKQISQLVNPGFSISSKSTKVHSITNEMVKKMPDINKIQPEIKKLLKDVDYILIHHGGYSIPFLQRELGIRIFSKKEIVDLLKVSMFIEKSSVKHDLDSFCKRYRVKWLKNHRVINEAKAIYQCFEKMLHKKGFTLGEVISRFK
ncbi:MAG: exonuclease domain-containing protein [Elusimicrobia bacterium]|nr:exonuclease domain-containing protein [Elusimicrobiota bacterium]